MNKEINTNLQSLPEKVTLSGDKSLSFMLMLFAIMFGGFPAVSIFSKLIKGTFSSDMIGELFFFFIGVIFLIVAINQLIQKGFVLINKNQIEKDFSNLFKNIKWKAQITEYEGILSHNEYHSNGQNRAGYNLYFVELVHSDPQKTIRLFQSKSSEQQRKYWEYSCKLFDLPALEYDQDLKIISRNVNDLDKTIHELKKEHKISLTNLNLLSPPSQITSFKQKSEHIFIISPKFSFVALLSLLGGPIFFILAGKLSNDAPTILIFIGVFVMIILLIGYYIYLQSKEKIIVTENKITKEIYNPWTDFFKDEINTSDIEQIKIEQRETQSTNNTFTLKIKSDQKDISIGFFLKKDKLNWLKDALINLTVS